MRIIWFAAATVLLVLAVGAALLAADVRTTERALAAGETNVPTLAGRALGVRADIAARRAVARFSRAVTIEQRLDNATQTQARRGRAESALAEIARDPNGARASQAETLLGVLVFTDLAAPDNPFGSPAGPAPDQVDESIADFQNAVRDDPSNETAKFDLELIIRTLAAQGTRVGSSQQSGAGANGRRGAGGGIPGKGY
jgi:hypothetical protein